MGLQQNLVDFIRDFRTRIDGATELMQNIVTRIRQPTPRLARHDFHGKVCIVTGGNTGVGQATAEAMVARGARVIIACRDKARADAAAEALSTTQPLDGCTSYPVETGSLDLASLDSVRSFASGFNARGLPLALLICNAGIMAPPHRLVTKDGLEHQFQVNYLGHWLLARELLAGQHQQHANSSAPRSQHYHDPADLHSPLQQQQHPTSSAPRSQHHHDPADQHSPLQQQQHASSKTPAPHHGQQMALQQGRQQQEPHHRAEGTRVVMLTSLTYRAGRLKFDDLAAERSYSGFHRYADSKLAELLAVREFAQRMDRRSASSDSKDTIVAVHPGLLQTELARKWLHNDCPRVLQPFCLPIIDFLFDRTFLPPQYAVRSVLQAAIAPADQVHGKYIARNKITTPARHAQDDAVARRLWDTSCQLTGAEPDEL